MGQRTSVNYRKRYTEYFGAIPVDPQGRSYEIHHRDGNDQNNDPKNLMALSVEEHFNVHYAMGDWDACLSISARMGMPPEERNVLKKLLAEKRARMLEAA